MITIKLETFIKAPVERVFDLARSIDLHKFSAKNTNEEAVAGRTSGLIDLNETVTWRARHFGIHQYLTVRIIQFDRPHSFTDRMIKGAFKSMEHVHKFEATSSGTTMIDTFTFTSPLGILGKLIDVLFLRSYMTTFLTNKNKELKLIAEGNRWQEFTKAKASRQDDR